MGRSGGKETIRTEGKKDLGLDYLGLERFFFFFEKKVRRANVLRFGI